MTTAPKTNNAPDLILVTDFFRDNGYVNSPPSGAYIRVNNRLKNGTYPCLRVTQYKRYITAETAAQILAEHPPTPATADEPQNNDDTPTPALALVPHTDRDEATEPDETPADNAALRRDLSLLTLKVAALTENIGVLTDTIADLNHNITRHRK